MTRHRCAECGHQIPNGTGHVRSECFRQIAYCDFCWTEHAEGIPAQRSPHDIEVSQPAGI